MRPNVRRRLLRRFPYSILYTVDRDEVVILALAHQKRRPAYWHSRGVEDRPAYVYPASRSIAVCVSTPA